MSPFRNQLKTPEEIELEKKRAELFSLKEQNAVRESVFSHLKSEIRIFEQVNEDVLGGRITLLEDLEWQLEGLNRFRQLIPRCKVVSFNWRYDQ